jgi:hypothetical protein
MGLMAPTPVRIVWGPAHMLDAFALDLACMGRESAPCMATNKLHGPPRRKCHGI